MLARNIFFQDFNNSNLDVLGDDTYVVSSSEDTDESISSEY